MIEAGFRNEHILQGQKLAESLLKRLESEDPRVALIASAQVLMFAARACKLHRKHLFGMVETMWNAIMNPLVETVQDAASRLYIPGNG